VCELKTELHLTTLQQSLLYLLAASAGRLLRGTDFGHLWGADYVAESNLVDPHIRNLRIKLLNHLQQPRYIATVPGRGYRFVVTRMAASSSGRSAEPSATHIAGKVI